MARRSRNSSQSVARCATATAGRWPRFSPTTIAARAGSPPSPSELDQLKKQLEDQQKQINDLQRDSKSATLAGVGGAVVGGCVAGMGVEKVLSSLNGDDGTSAVTQGAACVVGGAGTLITYLAQVFVNNVVDNNVVD